MIYIRDGDKPFDGSPRSKECHCSRCLHRIGDDEVPIRLWTTNDSGKVDKNSLEFRYCEKCDYDSDTKEEETENNPFQF